jgi:L-fuculose-phosphate aldolase
MHDEERGRREGLVAAMTRMAAGGLNRGTSGNASVRLDDGMLITPTGVTPDRLTADSMVRVAPDGSVAAAGLRPSSEWRMHSELYRRRPDCNAVVHCHSRFATTLACAHRAIPPLHYMVGIAGRAGVPLAPYHPFGSAELAHAVADSLDGGYACLMANHGLIVVARDLARGLAIAEEIEEQAAVYWGTLAIGGPVLLSTAQMDEVFRRFADYGQKP